MARRAAKVDANQREIVDALRRCGADVLHLHTVGGGCPDLMVGHRGVNYLVEIKDGAKPKSARTLTACQDEFHQNWGGQIAIVKSVDEALNLIGIVRSRGVIS